MSHHPSNAFLCLATAAALAAGLGAVAATPAQAAAPVCDTMTAPINHVVNPSKESALLTRWPAEADKAASIGFTDKRGTPFRAAVAQGANLVQVHRLYHSRTADFVWIHQKSQIDNAVRKHGYVDQGVSFYASAVAAPCTVKVERFVKAGMHRFAVSSGERAALSAAGWRSEGAGFYAAPTPRSPSR